jgi:hypothetical protein
MQAHGSFLNRRSSRTSVHDFYVAELARILYARAFASLLQRSTSMEPRCAMELECSPWQGRFYKASHNARSHRFFLSTCPQNPHISLHLTLQINQNNHTVYNNLTYFPKSSKHHVVTTHPGGLLGLNTDCGIACQRPYQG